MKINLSLPGEDGDGENMMGGDGDTDSRSGMVGMGTKVWE